MTMVTYNPFHELEAWTHPESYFKWAPYSSKGSETLKTPRYNMKETPESFELTIEVPGVKNENIKMEVHDGVLEVTGHSEEETSEEKENFRVKQFGSYNFERSFRLGEGVDAENIEARMEHGILTVAIPKKEESKPKRIPINIQS